MHGHVGRWGRWGLSRNVLVRLAASCAAAALQDGRVPFHILGLKCPHCLSYNTRRLSIDRDGPPVMRGAQAGQA